MPMEPAPMPVDATPPPADPEPDLPPAADIQADDSYSWYDAIEFSAFVDAYVGVNYNFPKPQYGRNVLRAHDYANGLALSWVGVDASYPADPVGATISLRFGPTAHQIGTGCFAADKGHCDSGEGLENVKQAFGSWRPGGSDGIFQLDLGKFDTPFGAEVAESQRNMNYTRSMLYASQPVTHTGFRATFFVADAFDFKLLAVNGWNNSIDNNTGKSFGGQANLHLKNTDGDDVVTASLGYMGGPEHDDTLLLQCKDGTEFSNTAARCVASAATRTRQDVVDAGLDHGLVDRDTSNSKGWRHLLDLVVTAQPIERLRLVLNADWGQDNTRNSVDDTKFDRANYYGVLLGARVAVVEQFGVAARGEYFRDEAGFLSGHSDVKMDLVGGTLTLDYLPSDFLQIRLDNRLDWASRTIFNKDIRDLVGTQFTTTLGVVAHTD